MHIIIILYTYYEISLIKIHKNIVASLANWLNARFTIALCYGEK